MNTKPLPDDEMLAGKGLIVEFKPKDPESAVESPLPESRHLVSRCAAGIMPERVQWLWPARLAIGKQTSIAGDPGIGKSQLTIDIAARITTGGEWPCGEGKAPIGSVIILSAEDGDADTILPRLAAAGADLTKVHIVTAVRDEKGSRSLNLNRDLVLLADLIAWIGDVALVIIDPISSYLGGVDSHRNTDVRSVLEPLSEMANRLRFAVLTVTHFSKGSVGGKALHSSIGSIAFVGAPRAAFIVVEDSDHTGRRLLLSVKNNNAVEPPGLAFSVEPHEGDGLATSRISWEASPVFISADEAFAATSRPATGKAEAIELLREVLATGPVPATEAMALAKEQGLTAKMIRMAREALGVIVERDGYGPGSKSIWTLPEAS